MSDKKLLEPHLTQKDNKFFITSVRLKQFVDENELLKKENAILLEELKLERKTVDSYALDNDVGVEARKTQNLRKIIL